MVSYIDAMTFSLPALLIILLPFEWRTPLVHLGMFQITDLELAAYAVLTVLGASVVTGRVRFDGLDWAATGWLGAWALAGLAAPADYPVALKSAARLAVGPALCIALRGSAGAASHRLGRLLALVGATAAALGIAEVLWPASTAPLFAGFRAKATVSSFGLRASGPFEHANQFSCFVELTLPFALLAAADRDVAVRRQGWAEGALGLLAVVLGLSRSGWMAGLLAVAVTIWAGHRLLGGRRALALAGAAVLIMALPFGLSLRLRGRMLWPHAEPPFAASYAYSSIPSPRIIVMNHGTETWRATGPDKVVLSVHGKRLTPPIREAEVYLDLPEDVPRCGRTEVPIDPAHTLPDGRYLHVYEVLHPVWGYSSQWDTAPISGETEIKNGRATLRYAAGNGALRRPFATRAELWQAAWAAFRERPWLGLGPGRFQESYSRWLPQVEPDPRLHPNELYLHVLAEGGLVGAAALLVLVACALAALWRGLARPGAALAAAAGLGMLAGWLAHGVFDSFLLFNGCSYAFWVGLALATPKPESAAAPRPGNRGTRTPRRRLHRS